MSRREAIWLTLLALFAVGLFAASWWANERADHAELINAIWIGTHEQAVAALDQVSRLNARSEQEGCTALFWAVAKRDARLVRKLLDLGADPNVECFAPDDPGRGYGRETPLHAAAAVLPQVIPDLIAHGADVNAKDGTGATPLMNAKDQPLEFVAPLVDHGADPNVVDESSGMTPLQLAIQAGNAPVVRYLLANGGMIPPHTDPELDPIKMAAHARSLDTVKLVVEQGYSVNKAYGGALHAGDYEIVKYLVENGMDVNATDQFGLTALHTLSGSVETGDILDLLLDRGADVTVADQQGKTTLHTNLWGNNEELWAALVRRGADVNAADHQGKTPLHDAAEDYGMNAVQFLLEHGAISNARDAAGNTPLHTAMWRLEPAMVRLLLEHGADPQAMNYSGATPADMISYDAQGRAEAIEVMELLDAYASAAPRVAPPQDDDDGHAP